MSVIAARCERGWTLVELLVSMTLMIIVLSATLTALDVFGSTTTRNTATNDQQEIARSTIDQLTRQLRNLASPTSGLQTIAFADPEKLIFQTTDPSKQWVAYCLQTAPVAGISATPAPSTANSILWYQTFASSNPNASVPNTDCPDPSGQWTNVKQVVRNLTNNNVSNRSLFRYSSYVATNLATPVTDRSSIIRVEATLYTDLDLNKRPLETVINSEAFLRNQNQPPQARFLAFPSGNTYTLNGGSSTDPEGRTLKMDWYEVETPSNPLPADPASLQDCSTNPIPAPSNPWNFTCVGTGPVLVHDFSGDPLSTGVSPNKTVKVFLRVTDPGGLTSVSALTTGGLCPLNTDTTRSTTQCVRLPIT
jgi:type II secretory pathway pseudopilin PulG